MMEHSTVELLRVLKGVIDQANCALDYSGVDADHTLKRALERVSKIKCVCEAVIYREEARATAHLFAAAPALLAALKAHIPWEKEPPQGWGQWADAAHAIAKAEGRSE